jgi:hypothetical protein
VSKWDTYPRAVTGTWSDVERRALYLYENADEQSAAHEMAEAVLVLLWHEYERVKERPAERLRRK